MYVFKTFVTIVGLAGSLGYFPQAYKIWKDKSATSISISSFIIFSFVTFTWTIYGFVVHDPVIIISFIIGVAGSWSVLILSLMYKNK